MQILHPEAAASFNRRGIRLLDDVERRETFPPGLQRDFRPDVHVAGVIDKPIGRIVMERVNRLTGEKFELYISLDRGVACLEPRCSAELRSLARSISSNNHFAEQVDEDSVRRLILDWIAESLDGAATLQLAEYLGARVEMMVQECEIWIPIANLHVQSPLELGAVVFRSITQNFLDDRAADKLAKVEEANAAEFKRILDADRQKLQGLAAGVVSMKAEAEFATRKALALVEETLALLRVYHPANASWRTASHCLPFGSEGAKTAWSFLLTGGRITHEQRSYRWPVPEPWFLSARIIDEFDQYLGSLRDLLVVEKPTPFQRSIKESLLLYSRNNLAIDISDKLVV